SATREYPSLIYTFFLTHTVGGLCLNPEDKALYDEMLMLHGLGSNTPTGVPANARENPGRSVQSRIAHREAIPAPRASVWLEGVSPNGQRSWPLSDDKFSQMLTQLESQPEYGGGSGSGGCGDDERGDDEDGGEDEEEEDDS
nr:hypothetical protein [Tanacetum cinerariifolium]